MAGVNAIIPFPAQHNAVLGKFRVKYSLAKSSCKQLLALGAIINTRVFFEAFVFVNWTFISRVF